MTTSLRADGVNVSDPRMRTGPSARTKDAWGATKAGRTGPAPSPATPCFGLSELFDSALIEDHRQARALCQTCPAIVACLRNLADVKREGGQHGQPVGTWAGQLLEDPRPGERRTRHRIQLDDQMYDDQEARTAHAQFVAGNRTDWVTTGERVYQARKKRQSRENVAARRTRKDVA